MESEGIEPSFRDCQPRVLPLDDDPAVEPPGLEPGSRRCERRVLPLDDDPIQQAQEVPPIHPRVWSPRRRFAMGLFAPRTGLEPVSLGRQPSCDPVASRGVASSLRVERSSRV